jgi:ankyrin repeat protein
LFLHEIKANVNAKGGYGNTPLVRAAEEGYKMVIEVLLGHHDSQVDSRNLFNATPLALAAERRHIDILELLLRCKDIEAD